MALPVCGRGRGHLVRRRGHQPPDETPPPGWFRRHGQGPNSWRDALPYPRSGVDCVIASGPPTVGTGTGVVADGAGARVVAEPVVVGAGAGCPPASAIF